ncbi:folylpolyglutamate synthase [Spiroplasma helicoides]|uniref:Folylpolyglutamate synthase n=1 Tax=Spiroplasma helicoides TaxID=216938 RepID=A0A1B3SJC1_9MOLU|nr:Mur ligase family protein [Spiroplasma helicoides]AOG60033.1 folylpolyglutamate synthase [Spiroplasma helicoides]
MISVSQEIIPSSILFRKQYNLKKLLEDLNNPQDNFKVINVVGTNGKGSTSTFIYKNLFQKYRNVGLFTSPAFLYHNERIQVNNEFIPDDFLKKSIGNNFDLFKKYELTFFEIWTFIAIEYFNFKKIEIAVIEAGIGGVKDATSVFNNQICVCVTSIGLDHIEVLGNKIENIIENKIKIAKHNSKIYTTKKNYNYLEHFKKYTSNEIIFCEDFDDKTYQKYNKGIAKKVLESLGITYDINTEPPLGRQTILNKDPLFIIDGCHNLDGAQELVKSIKNIEEFTILFGSSVGRENNDMVKFLDSRFKNFYVTKFDHMKAWDLNLVNAKNKVYDWKEFLKNSDCNILVCGSLYFIPLVYDWYKEEKNDLIY